MNNVQGSTSGQPGSDELLDEAKPMLSEFVDRMIAVWRVHRVVEPSRDGPAP